MAFTFTNPTYDENGVFTITATTNGSSAAGSFNLGFQPRWIKVYETTPSTFEWNNQMSAGTCFKFTSLTTNILTVVASNGITVVGPADSTSARAQVTFGTGLHVNNSTYYAEMGR